MNSQPRTAARAQSCTIRTSSTPRHHHTYNQAHAHGQTPRTRTSSYGTPLVDRSINCALIRGQGMEDTALASELDRLQAMARELGARVDGEGAPPAARDLCAALAASVDRAVRLAAGGNGNAGPGTNNGATQRNSCRKAGTAKERRQVRVASVQDTAPLDDGLTWRKYGQKDILGAKYPRAYFRCTHRHTRGCQATKQVQRADADPLLFDLVYNGAHTCVDQQGAAPSLVTSPEQQQQQGSPVEGPHGGIQWPAEPMMSPGAMDGCWPTASSSCQFADSSGYAEASGLGADMDFEAQLYEFLNPSQFFQPEVQSM